MLYSPIGREEPQILDHSLNEVDRSGAPYDHYDRQQPGQINADGKGPHRGDPWPPPPQPRLNGQRGELHKTQDARGNSLNIIWPALAVVMPMTLFTAVTLGLVYGYRIKLEELGSNHIYSTNKTILAGSNIYVNFSATRLIFITSWSSSFAPVLIRFLMALWQAPLALQILQASRKGEVGSLATPYNFH